MKVIDIMGTKISENCIEESDYVLTIKTDKTGLLNTQKLDLCYKSGYQAVIDKLDEIKKMIKN